MQNIGFTLTLVSTESVPTFCFVTAYWNMDLLIKKECVLFILRPHHHQSLDFRLTATVKLQQTCKPLGKQCSKDTLAVSAMNYKVISVFVFRCYKDKSGGVCHMCVR
jgi:hypothetical protein